MKKFSVLLGILAFYGVAQAFGATAVMVQDFEKDDSLPKLWVVNIPEENASLQLSTDKPTEGKQCLKLHYHFTGDGQYLGVDVPVNIHVPMRKLRFQLRGDNSGTGYGVYITDASGETHKFRDAGKMKLNYEGWKEQTIDLVGGHETWGGDKNGKIDLPVSKITFEISTPGKAVESDLCFDSIFVDTDAKAEDVKAAQRAQGASVMVQDFGKEDSLPKLWVVNIPDENASLKLSTDKPAEGKQCLKLHYHFTGDGQYLGLDMPVNIHVPARKLRFQIRGDNSGTGYGVYLTDASGETHKFRDAGKMKINFEGWKEQTIDLTGGHETWGGDGNGKIDLPVEKITFEISTPGKAVESDLYFDAIKVDTDPKAMANIAIKVSVVSPAYCSEIKGDTAISVSANGFKSVTAKCWKQGPGFGSDSVVAEATLDDQGKGSFVFPADNYPHGPVTITISAVNGDTKDNCYLQLYNKGGVSWNEGLPSDPPAAEGLSLIFADDFSGKLSISSTDPKATYYDHKPPDGSQDFSSLRFTGFNEPNNPFLQVDSYLRIRADAKHKSAGLISSLKKDFSGVVASAPCYFECRFIGPNAVGAWPAFWLLTVQRKSDEPCDEIDIIEAYGGEGPKSPNAFDKYCVTPHAWAQGDAGKAAGKAALKEIRAGKGSAAMDWAPQVVSMKNISIPSTWYETFHIYGVKITETDTIYYCDNIEIGRHKTLDVSKKTPFFFLINLATGGGWPVDLSRYDGVADMYVDYVRVYGTK